MPVDLKSINRNDQGVMGAAILVFIFSFVTSFVTASAGGFSVGISAWHSWGVLGLLLVFAAAAVVAVRVFAGTSLPALPLGWAVITTGLAGLGALLLILRGFTYGSGGFGISVHPGWSGYLLFILAIAETVFAALGLRESGEKIAWQPPARGAAAGAGGAVDPGPSATQTWQPPSAPPPPPPPPPSSDQPPPPPPG
ncbi:MAG: hypothetical protein ACRDP1_11025 [Nocardioidaceae bacterium]